MSNKPEKVTLDDMVFENRNKEYGAYYLRKNYKSYINRALLIGGSIFLLLFGGAYTYQNYILPNLPKDNLTEVEIDLSKIQEAPPEELPDLPPPPPPPPVEPPPEVAQIKFLPPEPKKDEEVVIEEPPPPAEKIEKAVISNKTVKGVEVVDAFIPPPPPEEVKIVAIEKPKEEEIFTAVEQNPEFPGGTSEMYKYLGQNIKYPAAAQRANVSGRVFVKFVVEKDGSIGKVEVLKGIGFGCDEEAIRVIKSMPKWNPGRQNGKNVRVFYNMPVVYKLD
ncbi:energy transducer TonB [Lacihabitans lacunae]|jgi:periplasmic protein TonB|uniref:Energy transducer TonB n=1 Tax=Lacihabitans lacunae TaxID=1028214 RepID=A0ABV7Z0X0_9BACT